MDQSWSELLKNYGPFALLPLAIFVIERLAAKRAHDPALSERVRNVVYGAAWTMIFLLCGLVVVFWYLSLPVPQEAMMRGRVIGLKPKDTLRGSGPEMNNIRVFTYRDPQQPDQVFWRTYSSNPLPDSTPITFLIDHGGIGGEEAVWRFRFTTRTRYYAPAMELDFELKQDPQQLILRTTGGGQEVLTGERIVIADARSVERERPRFSLFETLLAQSTPTAGAVIANLEADDPLVRLTARKQLAALGPGAAADMSSVLAEPGSSYRAKLGVLVAANQMALLKPEQLTMSAWCQVWVSSQASDETLRSQASLLFRKHPQAFASEQCLPTTRRSPSTSRPSVPPARASALPPGGQR